MDDDSQRIYERYVQKFGYPPALPKHLMTFSRISCDTKMKFMEAKKIITRNHTIAPKLSPNVIHTDTKAAVNHGNEHNPTKQNEHNRNPTGNNGNEHNPMNPYLDTSLQQNFISSNDAKSFIEKHEPIPKKSNVATAYDLYKEKNGSYPIYPTKLLSFCLTNKIKLTYSQCREYIASQNKTETELFYTETPVPVPASETKSYPKSEPKSANKSASNDDEKKTDNRRVAAPILCRVNFECSSETAKQEICDALNIFAKLQIDTPHPDCITYHFTCCDVAKHPFKLEFTELYYDETVYWQHANHPRFTKAFFKAFKNENRKSRDFITVSSHLSDTVKRVNAQWGSIFPGTDAGYLLNENYLKALDCADGTQMMVKWMTQSPQYYNGKKHNVQWIRDIMNKLAVYAQESCAIIFHSHRLAPKAYPDRMETVGIWPTRDCVEAFWNNKEVQRIMMEFKEWMSAQTNDSNRKSHVLCEVYGDKMDQGVYNTIATVFNDIGVIKHIKTDIGYILHPQANSNNLPSHELESDAK